MAKKAVKTTKSTTSTARTTRPAKTEKVAASTSKQKTVTSPKLRLKKSYAVLVAGVIVVIALIYALRGYVVAATVNGQPISRISVVTELERQGGKQALNALVTKTLILQEARKQNVSVSQEEVDGEIKRIEENIKKQGQTLDQALMLQGMTREQLTEQIRLQKMIEKIVGKDIKVDDKEVAAYIEQNKDALPQEADLKKQQDMVREQLKQQKLNDKINKWIENLRKNAKINSFVSYFP